MATTITPTRTMRWAEGRLRLLNYWIARKEAGAVFLSGHAAGTDDIDVLRREALEVANVLDRATAAAVAEAEATHDPDWLDKLLAQV